MSTPVAVAIVAVAAFLFSGAYYAVLAPWMAKLSPAYTGPARPVALTAPVELVRNLILGAVCGYLVRGLTLAPAAGLALALWVAFPAVLLAGSVYHERVPVLLAAIHAGDWLIKLMLIVVGVALLT